MPRRLATVLGAVLGAAALCGAAAAADWRGVPGAPDVQVDVGSLQQQRGTVTGWLRFPRDALAPARLAAPGGRMPTAYHVVLHTRFDCVARKVQMLAAQGHDIHGAAVFMSSVPGPLLPLPQLEDLAWAYDALCELARVAAARP